jgi:uncharacterized protein (TIGR02145 family)
MKKLFTILFIIISFCLNAQTKGTFTDNRDNKTYRWIKIGEQVWMRDNLKYKDTIFYDYKSEKKNDTLKLVASCPDGWHLPTLIEWNQLFTTLGRVNAANRLQEENSFDCLLNGRYNADIKSVENRGTHAYYWTSTVRDENTMWTIFIFYGSGMTSKIDGDKRYGYSIRCIKDK